MAEATVDTTIVVDGVKYRGELARAKQTYLGWEDHGLFMLNIDFAIGGYEQGLGRILIQDSVYEMVVRVLATFGVDNWERIRGNSCYVLYEFGSTSINQLIRGLVSLDGKKYVLFD